MKFPNISIIMNTIYDLNDSFIQKIPKSISELRKHAGILIIDDNDFLPEEYLKSNGFQIQHKKDIDTIKDVEPYEIIMCDISGVGKKLGYAKEGAFIIREIHANYPDKRIIAYTSYTFDADYNQFFSLADFIAPKDFAIDNWIDVLDDQIKKACDPVTKWLKIREYLLDNDISTLSVAKMEDKFVSAVKKKNFNSLQNYIKSDESKFQSIFTEFASSLCAKIILGLIGG